MSNTKINTNDPALKQKEEAKKVRENLEKGISREDRKAQNIEKEHEKERAEIKENDSSTEKSVTVNSRSMRMRTASDAIGQNKKK